LLFVLAIAVGARGWSIGDRNVWLDEAASWHTASQPVAGLLASAAEDVHPPMYYLLLKGWMALAGDSPSEMRWLSAIFGLVGLGFAHRLAAGWMAREVALAALCWMAVSPLLVFFAQEARMYAPATACVLAACLAYRRWVDSGFVRTGALAWYAAAAVAALYLHYFTALIVMALWVHLGSSAFDAGRAQPRGTWPRWLLANGLVLATFLPWLPVAAAQLGRGQPWRAPVPPTAVPEYALWLSVDLLAGYHFTWTPLLAVAFAAVAAVTCLGWFMLVSRGVRRDDVDRWLVIVVVVPAAAGLAALPVAGDLRLSRYLCFLTPLVVLGAVRGLSHCRIRPPTVLALIGVAALGSLPWLQAYYRDTSKDTDVRPVVNAIETRTAPSGSQDWYVVVEPAFMDYCLRYYWRDREAIFVRIDEGQDRWTALSALTARQGPGWYVVARDAVSIDAHAAPSNLELSEIPLQPARPDRIRLFRITPTAPAAGRSASAR
jgi:4-amino-4-deoxy-L-arabinose transferase-like glycosyltransferase